MIPYQPRLPVAILLLWLSRSTVWSIVSLYLSYNQTSGWCVPLPGGCSGTASSQRRPTLWALPARRWPWMPSVPPACLTWRYKQRSLSATLPSSRGRGHCGVHLSSYKNKNLFPVYLFPVLMSQLNARNGMLQMSVIGEGEKERAGLLVAWKEGFLFL